jgi:DNA-binding MarR family transcriptional regulator
MKPAGQPPAQAKAPASAATAAPSTASAAAQPQGCTNLKLRQAARRVTAHYERYVAPTGLKITQYSLLSHVVKLGPLRLGELATAMQLGASTLTRNLAPLVQQGWVVLENDPTDARGRVVVATPAGTALRAEAQRAWKRAQLALNERLGQDRVAALHALIDECLPLLDEAPDGDNAAV